MLDTVIFIKNDLLQLLDIIISNVKHQFKILNMIKDNYITWKNLAYKGLDKIFKRNNLKKSTIDREEIKMKNIYN